MEEFFNKEFLGNSYQAYTIFIGLLLISLVVKGVLSRLISHIIFLVFKKSAKNVGRDKFDELVKRPLEFIVILIAVYIGGLYLEYPENLRFVPDGGFGVPTLIKDLFYIFLVYGIIWLGMKLAEFMGLIFSERASATESKLDDQLVPFIVDLIKVIVVIIGILIILADVFEVNVATLVAGLGIGGIALAMASKDSIENLLGSFTIFFDQPFKVGEFITMGGVTGTVEKVGFRSTRIRTLDKTYVTVPNRNIINNEVDNYSERTHRRSSFHIGLTYETTEEQLKNICKEILVYLLDKEETTNDPVVRFTGFGDSSLNILIQYLAYTVDYGEDLAVKEEINYKIMQIVYKHKASFAFPSQSIYLEKTNN